MPEAFINKRVKVTLHNATLLRKNDIRTHNFALSINLSEDGVLIGLPEWIQNSFTLAQKSGNRAKIIKSDTTLEAMSLGFWSTEKTRSKFFSQVVGATLTRFQIKREGHTDESDVFLHFTAYFPGRKDIHDWTYDHKQADFWMDFEQQQGDLDLEVEEEDEEEDVEEEEEDE